MRQQDTTVSELVADTQKLDERIDIWEPQAELINQKIHEITSSVNEAVSDSQNRNGSEIRYVWKSHPNFY